MSLEQVEEVRMILFGYSFEVKDFAKIGVRFVSDVDEVGLNESLWRRSSHLYRLQKWRET